MGGWGVSIAFWKEVIFCLILFIQSTENTRPTNLHHNPHIQCYPTVWDTWQKSDVLFIKTRQTITSYKHAWHKNAVHAQLWWWKIPYILKKGLCYGKTLNDTYLLYTYFLVSDSNYHTKIISYKNIFSVILHLNLWD